jgi:hypothetical protein
MDFDSWKGAVESALASKGSGVNISSIDSKALTLAYSSDMAPTAFAGVISAVGAPAVSPSASTSLPKIKNATGVTVSYILNTGAAFACWILSLLNIFIGSGQSAKVSASVEQATSPAGFKAAQGLASELSQSIWAWTIAGSVVLIIMGVVLFTLGQFIKEYALQRS